MVWRFRLPFCCTGMVRMVPGRCFPCAGTYQWVSDRKVGKKFVSDRFLSVGKSVVFFRKTGRFCFLAFSFRLFERADGLLPFFYEKRAQIQKTVMSCALRRLAGMRLSEFVPDGEESRVPVASGRRFPLGYAPKVLSSACRRSAMMSSTSSIPTERRMRSGATPASRSCSSESWRWVWLAG